MPPCQHEYTQRSPHQTPDQPLQDETGSLDRLGSLTTRLELSSLTRGRVMQYAIPEHLKGDYGITSTRPRTAPWTPPPVSPKLAT